MKKALSFAAISAVAISAVAVAPVTTDAAANTAGAGFYDTAAGKYYSVVEFQKLSDTAKVALLTKAGVYLHTGAVVVPGSVAVGGSNEAIRTAAVAKASFTAVNLDAIFEASKTPPVTGELKVESVSAINPTTIKVTFDKDLTAANLATSNFTLSKGTVEGVSTETGNAKVAIISVKGLTYGDKSTVTVGSPAFTKEVTVPAVSDLYTLEITTDAPSDTLKSDGATKTQVTVVLKDKLTGQLVDRDGIIQFQATDGGLGQTTSAFTKGKATVQLTSIASPTSVTSVLTATVSDVPGAQEFKGLTAQKSIIFSPNAVTEGQVKFVTAVSAESTQGDRLFVTFSDKISAAAYKTLVTTTTGATAWDATRGYGMAIDGRYVKVKDVVQKTDNSLEFILDVDTDVNNTFGLFNRIENSSNWYGTTTVGTPAAAPSPTNPAPLLAATEGNYLRDNAEHTVSFPSNVGSLVLANSGIKFIKTDTSRPGVYGVTAQDQLNFTVRYTESVKRDVAETASNYLINGKQVVLLEPTGTPISVATQIATAKSTNKILVTSIKNGVYTAATTTAAAKDERNLVKFVLHSDFALASGAHQIQISNILDYAGDVDVVQNKLETDTFDFTLVADTVKPVASVVTESPEQWLVSYDKVISTVTGKTAKDVFKVKTGKADDAELVIDQDFHVYQVDASGVAGKRINSGDSIANGQYFLIEFLEDWTVKYDTKSNTSKTYFGSTQNPYKLTLENVRTLVGNVANKQELNVSLVLDGTSPTILTATDVFSTATKKYNTNVPTATGAPTPLATEVPGAGRFVHVTYSEPMQVNSKNNTAKPAEGLTPSQDQYVNTGVALTNAAQLLLKSNDASKAQAVSPSTYEFVKGDKVVKAEVVINTIAANDKSFVLEPEETLEVGTWTLYVRSITDDIGNALTTSTTQVVIQPSVAATTGTQVAWAAFDDHEATGVTVTDASGQKAIPNVGLKDYDAIYVKFTKEMNPSGANGVSRTQNYVFMGNALPIGSKVLQGIEGVTNKWDGVTILVPTGTWNGASDDYSVALNVASNFTSATGETLSGAYEVELFDGNTDAKVDSKLEAAYTQTNGVLVTGTGTTAVKAAVLSATATDAGTALSAGAANGKIDTITLTTDRAITVPTTGTAQGSILVNGKTFVATTSAGDTTVVYKAKTAADEIEGTATSALQVTAANSSILVNTGSVVDGTAPFITKAQLNGDKTKVTLTFSEAVTGTNTYPTTGFSALTTANFTGGGTFAPVITAVEHVEGSANTVVLSISNGTALTSTSTIDAAVTVHDFAKVAEIGAPITITGVPSADVTAASAATLLITNANTSTLVAAARVAHTALTPAQQALVTNLATLVTKEASVAKIATDKAALTEAAIKNANADLANVKTSLTALNAGILATGAQGSVIAWGTANGAVTNVGVVTRATTNTSGDLTATLTNGGITDTKVFPVTVLAKTFTLTATALTGVTITNDGTTSGTPSATQSTAVDGISLTLTPATDAVNFAVTGTKSGAVITGDITVDVVLDGVTKQFKVTIGAAGAITAVTPL